MNIVRRMRALVAEWTVIRNRPSAIESAVMSAVCIALALGIWFVATAGPVEQRIVDPVTLPSLADTVRSMPQLWFERALARGAAASLGRVLGGFALAAAIAVPLGVCAGSFLRLNAFLRPLSIFGRNIPVAALIPLTLMWFGLDELQKVMFIFFASVAFIFSDTVRAIEDVPDSYLDAAYTLGARTVPKRGATWAGAIGLAYGLVFAIAYYWLAQRPGPNDAELIAAWRVGLVEVAVAGFIAGFVLWFPPLAYQAVQKVLLPLAMPDVVNSLRLLFGLAFGYIMLAEVINAKFGLGAIINLSQRQGPREHIYLSLILISLLAFGIDRAILSVQRWCFPYRRVGDH
ncbi:MAG: ABC transporter permease subunit [Candidatus Hydrogenedentes bacterium]|nr:ABC transporter permease subunit [Candidatus Hydrogenedentota bacterium]